MKNCNCKETEITTQCKPDPCNCVCKMPVDECTNKVVYYITLASAVLMSCNSEETVEHVLNQIRNDLENLNYITNDDAWRALIEKIKAHISDLNPELTTLIDNRIGEIINLDDLIEVFNTQFEEWKDLLNDLISQASTIVLDDNVTENSSNGVKSSGIYAAINNLPQPDWDEDIPTLHSHILNKPTKLSDFENDLEPFHIGFATSDYSHLTGNEQDTVEFKIKAKNFIGTGVWNYEDLIAIGGAIHITDTVSQIDYKSQYNNYIGSNFQDLKSVNEMINYVLNTKYYPVLIEPVKNNPYPESGVYYDLNTELFFNLIKENNNNYKARYLKRGPAVVEGQPIIVGAISENTLLFEKSETDNQYTCSISVPIFQFDGTPEIKICIGIDYVSAVENEIYPTSELQKMSYEFVKVNDVSKDGNKYIGTISNVTLEEDIINEKWQLRNDGDLTFSVAINSKSGTITLTSQSANNEP